MQDNLQEKQNNEARAAVKQRKLSKVVRRSFVMGFISCLVALVLLLFVARLAGVGGILIGPQYSEYKGLKTSFGKCYQMARLIEKHALNDFDDEGIDDSVLAKVVEKLNDPYARYFTSDEYKEYMKHYDFSYVGIGVVINEDNGKVVVAGLLKTGPAKEAGIEPGDIILEIDGKKITTADESTAAIKGEPGTEVAITVERDGKNKEFKIVRTEIEEDSVHSEVYDKKQGIGYVQIRLFGNDTAKDFKLAIKDLKSQGCSKVIIDLRNNGGGLTNEAYKVADYLLPSCIIDTEKYKSGKEKVHKSRTGDAGIKYAVLVNKNTASASEIVSAAIQDNKGGKIIGTRTYGKGVTQAMHKFKDGSAVKFTVTEYFRPSGKKVNGVGITPDIIEEDNDEMLKKAVEALK